jgi:hypothetical protein
MQRFGVGASPMTQNRSGDDGSRRVRPTPVAGTAGILPPHRLWAVGHPAAGAPGWRRRTFDIDEAQSCNTLEEPWHIHAGRQ